MPYFQKWGRKGIKDQLKGVGRHLTNKAKWVGYGKLIVKTKNTPPTP